MSFICGFYFFPKKNMKFCDTQHVGRNLEHDKMISVSAGRCYLFLHLLHLNIKANTFLLKNKKKYIKNEELLTWCNFRKMNGKNSVRHGKF